MITAEQIQSNWDKFLNIIDTHITGERKDKLLEFYKQYEDRFVLLPASHKKAYHNCFPGGYIDHVIRVIEAAIKVDKVWREMGMVDTMSENEYIAIKTHDGMYDEANKSYLLSYMPETKPRSSLLYVLHQADMMAARIEYEVEWLPKLVKGNTSKPPKKEFVLNKSGQSAQKQKAMKSMGNDNLANILKNI
jgi:hypothetical protein